MFELSVALRYLIPRWRQLSVSIISLISIAVISLVVWLIVVFFSVTNGMEKNWIEKLVSLTAPVRVTPTEAYYQSYYHQIDSQSEASDYTPKSLGEKLQAEMSDPYDPDVDAELPSYFPQPLLSKRGKTVDLVKSLFDSIHQIEDVKGVIAEDYEITISNLRLNLLRQSEEIRGTPLWDRQSFLSQLSYLSSYSTLNPRLEKTLLLPSGDDYSNYLNLLSLSADNIQEDHPTLSTPLELTEFLKRVSSFLKGITITHLKTPESGWQLPEQFYPTNKECKACLVMENDIPTKVILPQQAFSRDSLHEKLRRRGIDCQKGTLQFSEGRLFFYTSQNDKISLFEKIPLILEGELLLPAKILEKSILIANTIGDLRFSISLNLQGMPLKGRIPLQGLKIGKAFPAIGGSKLPRRDPYFGDGAFLPKSFKDSGVLMGDRGYLSFYTSTASAVQEQRLPIWVAGFYDPGLMPIGGKLLLVDKKVTSTIRTFATQQESSHGNGINIWFDDLSKSDQVKSQLERKLREKKIDNFWKVETYENFEFSKDFIQQLQSDKTLFMLIALIIIIVACSNIISMLILLVNDKKKEIGILLSMGAKKRSIALIFGFCGTAMGLLGSLIGVLAALLTLKNIQTLVDILSAIQGHAAFNVAFFGDSLPDELSFEALTFVLVATAITSLLAGIVPAIKASSVQPSKILRSE